jgi:GWxTD domain-containing protein
MVYDLLIRWICMYRFIQKILILLILSMITLAYGQFDQKTNKQISMDHAAFRASEDWTYLELYFTMPRDMLQHAPKADRFEAMYETTVSLYFADSLAMQKNWKDSDTVTSMDDIKRGQSITNQTSFYIKEGTYKIRTAIVDLTNQFSKSTENTIEIHPLSRSKLDVSDLQFAVQLRPDTTSSRFNKNGYTIVPNPTALYGLELPMLYYYCEIYNLSLMSEDGDNTYTVTVSINDGIQNVVKELKPEVRQRKGQSLVEVGMVNVSALSNGTYTLFLEVTDQGTADTASSSKAFYIYRLADTMQDPLSQKESDKKVANEFAFMSEGELDLRFEQARYIAENDEKKVYKKLDLDGKRNFLYEFWQQRDDDAFTRVNEYKESYYRRIDLANKHYTHGKTPGWKTAQGRILIMYGEPDRIDRYPSSGGAKGYEFWEYLELQNRSVFVFVDVRSDGRLRLVHSTYMDEIQDREWRRWLH